jgi:hypothetical protein
MALVPNPGLLVNSAPTALEIAEGATITIPCSATNPHRRAYVATPLAGNRSLVWTGLADGMTGVLTVQQDATGAREINPVAPAGFTVLTKGTGLSTTPDAWDVIAWEAVGDLLLVTFGGFTPL